VNVTKKPTLLSLRQKTAITTQELAQKAGVSLTEVYIVEIGGFSNRMIAEKVISAFSLLSGMRYTLNDIRLQNVSTPIIRWARFADLDTLEYPIPERKKR
jgi:DNA-binding XRE family transcriptional regulator